MRKRGLTYTQELEREDKRVMVEIIAGGWARLGNVPVGMLSDAAEKRGGTLRISRSGSEETQEVDLETARWHRAGAGIIGKRSTLSYEPSLGGGTR